MEKGTVKVALANVYRSASESAGMVTQALFATAVDILDEKKVWAKIQIPVQQNYAGWIKNKYIFRGEPPARSYRKTIVWEHRAALKDEPRENSRTMIKVPLSTRLWVLEKQGDWSMVWLPGSGRAWLDERRQEIKRAAVFRGRSSGESILGLARTFRGVPYLWGGITPEGFDCSGFVLTLYALHGCFLHRDTDQQYENDGLSVDMSKIRPGDLLYFYEETAEKPTHVGIYEGGRSFINASSEGGGVVSYNLEEYKQKLKISGAKRIFDPF